MTDSTPMPGAPINPLSHTREQLYASKVYLQVMAFRDAHTKQEQRDAYKSLVQSLPVLVRTAGLAQALAFVATRKDEPQRQVLLHLNDLLKQDLPSKTLIEYSREAPLSEYMYLTRQVMSALLWYKRYAEWLLDDKRTDATPAATPASTVLAKPDSPEEHAV